MTREPFTVAVNRVLADVKRLSVGPVCECGTCSEKRLPAGAWLHVAGVGQLVVAPGHGDLDARRVSFDGWDVIENDLWWGV